MKKLLLLLFCLPILVLSQTEQCGTMQYLEYLQAQDPQLAQKMAQDEIDLQNRIQNQSNNKMSSVITIPVVVHVVYNNLTNNISDAQIQSQIDILNEDFRRLNADTSSTPLTFQSVAADVEIEFCLASQDPYGITTNGITRTLTSQFSFTGNDDMKFSSSGGIDAWNTNDYLNIWVCNLSGGLLGYAQFPNSGSIYTDGVVCDYEYFGNIGTATSPFHLGRTVTHEVGHWLNLRHIWGDAYCGDDFCNDTPTQEQSNGGCPTFPHLTCSNGPNGDMFMNYMDYSNDACMNMFTEDQKTRMLDAINTHRSALLTSNGCNTGTIIAGCTNSTYCNYDPLATIDDGTCATDCGCDTVSVQYLDDINMTWGSFDVYASGWYITHTYDYGFGTSYDFSYIDVASSTSYTTIAIDCDSYIWLFDGNTYTTSGIYTYTSTNVAGCTHTETLDLTINNSTSSIDTHVACDEFMWNCDGNLYTSSNNTATYTYTNTSGCDSVVTLDLTINNSTSSTDTHIACDEFMWNCDGNLYTSSNNTATYTYTNASGCDSVVTLDLTINNSTLSTDTHIACDEFMWNCDGNLYTSSNNTATYTYTNASGCDSVVTLDLTINNSTSNTTQVSVCDSYTWAIDGNTYTNSGTYTDVSTNTDGCDHTETLDLTINSVIASISQSGDSLFAVTTPIGLTANWYNIQTEDATTRIWLMEEGAYTFMPIFDCSYFIVVSDNACIDTSEIYSYGANATRIGSFVTSPNPTSGLINVKFENSKNQFVIFELISNNGSKLDEFITIEDNLNIDLSKYPSGSYYLYFNSEDAVQGCRLEEVQKLSTKIILNK